MDSQSWLSSCCGLLLQHTSKVDSIALTRLSGVLPFLASAEFSVWKSLETSALHSFLQKWKEFF